MTGLLVRLYPRQWRCRYGEEFGALLDTQPSTLAAVCDIVRGALDARLSRHGPQREGTDRESRAPGASAPVAPNQGHAACTCYAPPARAAP